MTEEKKVYYPKYFNMVLIIILSGLFAGFGIYLFAMGDEFDNGNILYFPAVCCILIAAISIGASIPKYRVLKIGPEGLAIGRTEYPWENIKPGRAVREQVQYKAMYFITVGTLNSESINLIALRKSGEAIVPKRFNLHSKAYNDYAEIKSRIISLVIEKNDSTKKYTKE